MTTNDYQIYEVEQGTQEWLDLRQKYIGSSDAPIIMGVSPYKTPNRLWKEKLCIEEQEAPTIQMLSGRAMEAEIRAKAEKNLGISLEAKTLISTKYPFMIASLDGWNKDAGILCEMKLNNKENHAIAKRNKIVDHHMYQIQHQLIVSGAKMAVYASFNSDELILIKVNPDKAIMEALINEEEEFYNSIKNLVEPVLTDRDFVPQTSDEWVKAATEFVRIHKEKKALQDQYDELRDRLIFLAKEKSSYGSGVKVAKIYPKGRVDYKKIPLLQGVDLDPYRDAPKLVYTVRPDGE